MRLKTIQYNTNQVFENLDNVALHIRDASMSLKSNILITGKTGSGKTTLLSKLTNKNFTGHLFERNNPFEFQINHNGYVGLDELQIYSLERLNDFFETADKLKLKVIISVQDLMILPVETIEYLMKDKHYLNVNLMKV